MLRKYMYSPAVVVGSNTFSPPLSACPEVQGMGGESTLTLSPPTPSETVGQPGAQVGRSMDIYKELYTQIMYAFILLAIDISKPVRWNPC